MKRPDRRAFRVEEAEEEEEEEAEEDREAGEEDDRANLIRAYINCYSGIIYLFVVI